MNNSQKILEILLQYIQKNNTTEKQCLIDCNINTSFLTDWKAGRLKNPSYDKIVKLAEYLNIDLNLLFLGKTNSQTFKLTADEQELLSNYSKLTNDSKKEVSAKVKELTIGANSEKHNNIEDELYTELSKIVKQLPLKERSKLITIIYDFEEQYHKYGSGQMTQAHDMPVNEQQLLEIFKQFNNYEQVKIIDRIKEWLEAKRRRESANEQQIVQSSSQSEPVQSQWRITARRTDGIYESRFATPEEVAKLKLLLEDPNPEEPEY